MWKCSLKEKKKQVLYHLLLRRSRLLDTHQNYRRLSMEIESDSIHHARRNTVACMCCTHTHTYVHSCTQKHSRTSFIHLQEYKTHWVLRSERDNIHRYKVKCINQSHQCVLPFCSETSNIFIHINSYTCFHIQYSLRNFSDPFISKCYQ